MNNATQMPLALANHLNRGLFSDYYLNEIVPHQEEWDARFEEAKKARDDLRDLLSHIHPEALDESQLEEQWVRPVLDRLGHHYSVQVKVRYRDQGYRKPDYVLTATPDEARAFTNEIYNPQQMAHALAVADAKKWGVNLDQAGGRDERNPSQQIDEYLRYSELSWGILTDGRYWRLYERNTSKNNVYYAVDLVTLLQQGEVEKFLYFYAFFRQGAFTGDWLRRVLEGSEEFAQALSDQLEDQIYEALEQIAQGFLDYRRNRLKPEPQNLRTIYEQSLVFLYRLLFIFYAESREILPLHQNDNYTQFRSLTAIKRGAAQKMGYPKGLDPDNTEYYTRLTDLFFMIDEGSPQHDLPPYNGRLFAESEHPFLAEKAVGDLYMVPALDKMARVRVRDERRRDRWVFVDYRDLDVRHLGAIYEKLLEYELDIAAEPLAVSGGKYVPAKTGDKVEKQPGQVYLRTGNYERKITGSYYTPDYIVRFIVERTLEPLLADITGQYAGLDEEGRWQVHDRAGLRDAILSLNVLDPATGSGHFLVATVAVIAEWLRGLALLPEDLSSEEDELVYWKRQVVSACIYGVDVNPLAVELARLSLWLTTIARGKPLSFLDHHIRVGNSLVGARSTEIGAQLVDPRQAQTNGQLPLFAEQQFAQSVSAAVAEMWAIEGTIAETVQAVKQQEQQYAHLVGQMTAWKQVADVWTARYFGLELDQARWDAVCRILVAGQPDGAAAQAIVEQAAQIADQYRFLHWDLAFPEVFFGSDGRPLANPGFDAVVGNPPYVRQERIQPIKPYLAAHYEVYQGTADLFLYFYELGLRLVRREHRLGYITSGTYMNSNSATEFRRYIHEAASFETAVNFGENQPFRGAEMVYPTIAILRNGKPAPTFHSLFVEDVYRRDSLGEALQMLPWVETAADVTGMEEWRFQSVELTRLFTKINEGHASLGEVVDGRIYSGIKTGLSAAFIIDSERRTDLIKEHPSSQEIIRPFLRGQDLRPWYQLNADSNLIFAYQGIDIGAYPAIKRHLEQFQDALAKRSEAAAGQCQWYELRPCSYYAEFDQPKILWPDIAKLPRFSWDESGMYGNDKGFFVVAPTKNILAVLNSRPLWFVLSQIATPLRLRAGLWQYQSKVQFIERLPIPDLTTGQESQLSEIAEHITAIARERYRLHEAMRHRIAADLGQGGKLNRRLEEWWLLEAGSALRREVERAFKADIPLRQRDEWDAYLADQKGQHDGLTQQIVELETRMNDIVYDAFRLTPEERKLIEDATKYRYGEV